MSLTNNISVVALVISLIALFIALLQLSQSFLLTADGYRRCAESVLGAWSNLRHRHFRWSEFRFETQFVTPQILIVSDLEFNDAAEHHEIYRLTSNSMLDSLDCPELIDTVHKDLQSQSFTRPALKRNGVQKSETDLEKAENKGASAGINILMPRSMKRRRQRARANELLVSWLHLLKEIHLLYYSYCPARCRKCHRKKLETGWAVADVDHDNNNCYLAKLLPERHKELKISDQNIKSEKEESNTDRTDAAVIYRQWTWDFMPPDTVRPHAEANLGDIVVLARRMGMQWRDLDVKSSVLQAEGNGYSLTSTKVQGLGIVLKFSSVGRHSKFQRIVPSKAGDKLMCGMIPGDSDLVKRDFETVRPDRVIVRPHVQDGILIQIGVAENYRAEIEKGACQEPENEFLMLLCPFLPLKHSNIVCYNLFGFQPNAPVRKSVFHFWEGRWALFHRLGQRLEKGPRSSKHDDLKKIYDGFKHLEQTHAHDFYCRWGRAKIVHQWAVSKTAEERAADKESLIESCRNIFNSTTEYLRGPGMRLDEEDINGQTKYLHLCAAHTWMATHAVLEAVDVIKNHTPKPELEQEALRKKHGFKHGYHGNGVEIWVLELGLRYADHLHDPEHGIRKYLSDKQLKFTEDEVEAMWYCLMLRGVAWDMGSWANPDPGEPIPAMFYGDRTPVWIT